MSDIPVGTSAYSSSINGPSPRQLCIKHSTVTASLCLSKGQLFVGEQTWYMETADNQNPLQIVDKAGK